MGRRPSTTPQRSIPTSPSGMRYQAIAGDLCRRIDAGEWRIGARLPGRLALAKEYAVGLTTVQDAITNLVALGVLKAVDRSGTFVARGTYPSDYAALQVTPSPAVTPIQPTAPPTIGIFILGGYEAEDQSQDTDHWGNLAARSIERTVSHLGGRTFLYDITEFSDLAPFYDVATAHGLSAIILVDMYGALIRFPELVAKCESAPFPVIFLSSNKVFTRLPYITYDQQHAGFTAAQHLLQCGYRELLFLMPFSAPWATERLEGARAALDFHRLPANTLTVCPDTPLESEYVYYDRLVTHLRTQAPNTSILEETALQQSLLAALRRPTPCGIIAVNDSLAIEFIGSMRAHGFHAGVDYGIVGFDDTVHARKYSLTTLRTPMDAMGDTAARMMISLLQTHDLPPQCVYLQSSLIVRTSTRHL